METGILVFTFVFLLSPLETELDCVMARLVTDFVSRTVGKGNLLEP